MFGKHSVGGRPFLCLQSVSASLIDGDKIRVVPRAKFCLWMGRISGNWPKRIRDIQFLDARHIFFTKLRVGLYGNWISDGAILYY